MQPRDQVCRPKSSRPRTSRWRTRLAVHYSRPGTSALAAAMIRVCSAAITVRPRRSRPGREVAGGESEQGGRRALEAGRVSLPLVAWTAMTATVAAPTPRRLRPPLDGVLDGNSGMAKPSVERWRAEEVVHVARRTSGQVQARRMRSPSG